MTATDYAKYLGAHPVTVMRRCRAGVYGQRAEKVGNVWLIRLLS